MKKQLQTSFHNKYYYLFIGKAYFWCTCGRSSKQPFCDGSHKVVALRPMK